MKFEPAKVEMFCEQTWDKLRPDEPWKALVDADPEKAEMHRRYVGAYLEHGFNPEIVVPIVSNFKFNFNDLLETGQAFHNRLSEMLKDLVRKYERSR